MTPSGDSKERFSSIPGTRRRLKKEEPSPLSMCCKLPDGQSARVSAVWVGKGRCRRGLHWLALGDWSGGGVEQGCSCQTLSDPGLSCLPPVSAVVPNQSPIVILHPVKTAASSRCQCAPQRCGLLGRPISICQRRFGGFDSGPVWGSSDDFSFL